MQLFFVQDYKHKYRCFTSEPIHQIEVEFSRLKKIWKVAKEKLMLLPQRILAQEQAFEKIIKYDQSELQVFHSGRLDEKRIRVKFFFFLQKQRTKHIFLLIGETILLPISGLAVLIPGPNVFFGVLALLMITHWQALRGINKLLKKELRFIPASALKEWELALESKNAKLRSLSLEKIEKEYNLKDIRKILWK